MVDLNKQSADFQENVGHLKERICVKFCFNNQKQVSYSYNNF